jgi:ATP-dependent RNA helicase RhlE
MAYICNEAQKQGIIRHLFAGKDVSKVIIFSGSKLKVKELFKTFRQMKLSVGEMHSDLEQSQRDHIMHEFRNSRVSILVATDIVARGIDIDDITMVINYDVPHDEEDYVHRIGRTARAGESGMAITFVAEAEQYKFRKIEEFLEKDIEKLTLPEGMGEAPEYNPQANRFGHKKFAAKKGAMKRRKTDRKTENPSRKFAPPKPKSNA